MQLEFFQHPLGQGVWSEGRREFARMLVSCCHPNEQDNWTRFLGSHAHAIRSAILKNCWDFYYVSPSLLVRVFRTPLLLRVAAAVYLKGLEVGEQTPEQE
jgi:hypothetical protein